MRRLHWGARQPVAIHRQSSRAQKWRQSRVGSIKVRFPIILRVVGFIGILHAVLGRASALTLMWRFDPSALHGKDIEHAIQNAGEDVRKEASKIDPAVFAAIFSARLKAKGLSSRDGNTGESQSGSPPRAQPSPSRWRMVSIPISPTMAPSRFLRPSVCTRSMIRATRSIA